MNTRYWAAQRYEDTSQTFELGYRNRNHGSYQGFTELVEDYLFTSYSIDKKHNSWIEQIDHYAYIKELDWLTGFYAVLKEIYERSDFLKKLEKTEKTISFTEIAQYFTKIAPWRRSRRINN